MAAVTRDRLERLPGMPRVTWLEAIYYERSLLAAAVLVLLCIYATLISPNPQLNSTCAREFDTESSQPEEIG